jgi:NTP pyrophosphatase (non-canonical NTP hydrolase)
MNRDRLDLMFSLRESFMKVLRQKNSDISPEWPVDLGTKDSQQHIRDMALRGVEEMFEALQHLKNWKPHRDTEVREFDREEFLEEIVDAFNYFLSVLVLVGVSSDELYDAYEKKDKIIRERVKSGY